MSLSLVLVLVLLVVVERAVEKGRRRRRLLFVPPNQLDAERLLRPGLTNAPSVDFTGTYVVETIMRKQHRNKLVQTSRIIGVFIPASVTILLFLPQVGNRPLAQHGVLFAANLLTMFMVWLDLRLRGEGCVRLGLSFRLPSRRSAVRVVLQSLAVFVAAVAAVVVSAVAMSFIVRGPEEADMSAYDYLRGDWRMLILVLAAVYINASFGEELIYRAFLISRLAELGSNSKVAWCLGVLISSLVFGLIHWDWAIVGTVQMASMGLVLGVSYLLVRRNLWVTILAHGYLDTILIWQMYVGVT